MNHPLHSEDVAFRVLQIAVGTCIAAFAVVTAGGGTADVIAVSHVSAAVLTRLLLLPGGKRSSRDAPRHAPPARPSDARHRIVVIATTEDLSPFVHDLRERAAEHDSDVVLVCPALNSRLAHWVSDVDGAERAARLRVDAGLRVLVQAGIDALGVLGDANPLQAIEDALWIHGADELVLVTHADDQLHWSERHIVERVRARYRIPIEHLVAGQPPEVFVPESPPVADRVAEAPGLGASPAIAGGTETP